MGLKRIFVFGDTDNFTTVGTAVTARTSAFSLNCIRRVCGRLPRSSRKCQEVRSVGFCKMALGRRRIFQRVTSSKMSGVSSMPHQKGRLLVFQVHFLQRRFASSGACLRYG